MVTFHHARIEFLYGGPIGILLFLFLLALNSYSKDVVWQTEYYGNFVFEYPSEAHKTVAYLKRTCPKIEERIKEDLPLETVGQVHVILVTDVNQFLKKQPEGRITSAWIAGIAYPDQGLVILKSPGMLLGAHPDFEKLLYHEIAHIALHRALSCPHAQDLDSTDLAARTSAGQPSQVPCIPHWVHEGYAIFVAREWSVEREITLGKAVFTDQLIPLGRLVSEFPTEEHLADLAYAESADLIHFLRNRYGAPAFRSFIREMGKGYRFGGALRTTFGTTFQELEQDWVGHLKRRYHRLSILGSVSLLWGMATLLFLVAYVRKKILVSRIKRQWEDQEENG